MKAILSAIFTLITVFVNAQQVLPLYETKIPGAKKIPANYVEEIQTEADGNERLFKVSQPSLIIYQPKVTNGIGLVVCPGGGYSSLSIGKEGYEVANTLIKYGFTVFVLKYRLPTDFTMAQKKYGPLQDVLQALYLVRKNATLWHINPGKVGVMGFSAGGHLAALASTQFNNSTVQSNESVSVRPDFSVLVYPVISSGIYTDKGTLERLVGKNASTADKRFFSADKNVTTKTPPAFIVHANDDKVVPMQNSTLYNEALTNKGIRSELHIYQSGGHGFGVDNNAIGDDWVSRLQLWLTKNKLL